MNLRLRSSVWVPLADARVYLFVSYDAVKTYARVWKSRQFVCPDGEEFDALTVVGEGGGPYAMFFHYDTISESLIAHEIDHLTRLILQGMGIEKCPKCKEDEWDARLTGYLTAWVKKSLKRGGIKIALE